MPVIYHNNILNGKPIHFLTAISNYRHWNTEKNYSYPKKYAFIIDLQTFFDMGHENIWFAHKGKNTKGRGN